MSYLEYSRKAKVQLTAFWRGLRSSSETLAGSGISYPQQDQLVSSSSQDLKYTKSHFSFRSQIHKAHFNNMKCL